MRGNMSPFLTGAMPKHTPNMSHRNRIRMMSRKKDFISSLFLRRLLSSGESSRIGGVCCPADCPAAAETVCSVFCVCFRDFRLIMGSCLSASQIESAGCHRQNRCRSQKNHPGITAAGKSHRWVDLFLIGDSDIHTVCYGDCIIVVTVSISQ